MKKQALTNDEISSICMGLSMLLHAGVGVGDGLAMLSDEEQDGSTKELLNKMALQVDDGASLAEAVESSGAFPVYVRGLLEVGEKAGRTEEALAALSRHYEDRSRLNRQIKAALLYPAILLVIMLAVIGILLVRVLPVFNDVYAYLGGSLTGIAGGLLSLGQAIDAAMPVLCVILGVVVILVILFAAVPAFRAKAVNLWHRGMGDKGVSRKINTARFAQSLSMGLSSGLPMAQAMKASQVLPHSECRLLEIGLRSGTGDVAMEQISRRLSEDSEMALQELVGRVEPALVMVTSIMVGLILLSVMLPLMNIMSAIG